MTISPKRLAAAEAAAAANGVRLPLDVAAAVIYAADAVGERIASLEDELNANASLLAIAKADLAGAKRATLAEALAAVRAAHGNREEHSFAERAIQGMIDTMEMPTKPDENTAWNALVCAAVQWAKYLDQWDKFKFDTEYGPVYVNIGRQASYPDSYDKISDDRPMPNAKANGSKRHT